MKESRYNYFIPFKDRYIIFNGISERFFEIDQNNLEFYRSFFSNPDDYKTLVPNFYNQLKKDGFIIEENDNEQTSLNKKFLKNYKPNQYHLMILPTYQCNLRCWYCVQNHSDVWISDDITDRIKKRIITQISRSDINSMRLSWFGGEPLLAFDKVVEITRFAKETTEKHNKDFMCMITTNGTLLTEEKISLLQKLGVKSYQITIDGCREVHNKTKVLGKNKSAFDLTINNINLIARHTHCTLRFNYTHENLVPQKIIQELNSSLDKEVRNNISFSIYKVWQEDTIKVNPADVDKIFEEGKRIGLHSELSRCGMCYADQKHFDCIFPNGSCDKCDNGDISNTKGRITPNGDIFWDKGAKECHTPVFLMQSECSDCRYLPICWGPCEIKREDMLQNKGIISCYINDKDSYMAEMVRNIYKNHSIIQ